MEDIKNKNPFRSIWNLLSIPFAVLGLLGLSNSLLTFNENIQSIVESYQAIVYPPFQFIFGWLWFELPTFIFDYLFLGIMFASNELKVWGLRKIHESTWANVLHYSGGFLGSMILWPIQSIEMTWQIYRTRPNGIIKSLAEKEKPFYVRYMMRDADILVFRYIAATLLIFVLVLILNYTYLL